MRVKASSDRKVDLTGRERISIVLLYAAILAATLVGFFAEWVIGKAYVILAGLGIVAYVFGLRHGVDADHIAAIDNTTRKLMQEGKRPLTVGTWFSLGHSTIVVALVVSLVLATRAVVDIIPSLRGVGSVVGTTVSGAFLWLIGLINLIIAIEIYRIFRGLREGKLNEAELEEHLSKRGFMNRYFGKLFKLVNKPWQMYPVGVLFGLGFDTASEVALIAISVGVSVTSTVPLWSVLVLPLLFLCGMVLVDTSDAIAMRAVYGWAFLNPIRKIYYNLTITIISVLVAFAIGGVELLQVMTTELNLSGGIWDWFTSIDFGTLGYVVVALFIGCWAVSFAYYRIGHVERRMTAGSLRTDS